MRLTALLFLLLTASLASATEVYRTVDAAGNVVYTDKPVTGKEEQVTINVAAAPRLSSAPRPAAAEPRTDTDADGAKAAEEVDPEVAAAASAAQREEERLRNCATARDRNSRYETAHRLFRELPDGEREYLDDAEIDAARAQAIADIQTWCD